MDVLLPATSRPAGRRARYPWDCSSHRHTVSRRLGTEGWLLVSNLIFNSQFLSRFCCSPSL